MKRKIEHLFAMLARYQAELDGATTPEEIGRATRMVRLYENAIIALEEKTA